MEFRSRSTATTSPEGPTSRARSIATSPTPDPRSRTRCPGPMPASRKNLSVIGATCLAWRISRSCSASVWPSGYSAERGLFVIVQRKSHHQVAAVDIERSAGDITGGFGSGKTTQIGDFKSGAEARHRITCGEPLEQVVRGIFAREFSIDHTRADSVYSDAEFSELLRSRACQSEQSGLRCRVMRTAKRAHHPPSGGRNINDAAVVLGAHRWENGFRHQERCGEIDLDCFAPFLHAEIGKPGRERKRRVVHENVDPSKAFDRTLRNLIRDTFRSNITWHRERALADFLRQ